MSKRNLMAPPKKVHSGGNCIDNAVIYSCRECRKGNLCDVCHKHDMPRGECKTCPPCPVCGPLVSTETDR